MAPNRSTNLLGLKRLHTEEDLRRGGNFLIVRHRLDLVLGAKELDRGLASCARRVLEIGVSLSE